MGERHRIGTDLVSATVDTLGAELVSLKDRSGGELLWQAGPEWPRHAPVLFPIVGKLSGDTLRHGGKTHSVTQHGFARDALFETIEVSDTRLVFRLEDDAASLERFPFRFRLEMIYAVDGSSLSVTSRITNPGDTVLPCGIGAHPGFRWPLVDGIAKEAHVVRFERQESGPALGVEGGLLGSEKPLPFDGRALPLSEALFASDALVMPGVSSSSVSYEALGDDGETLRALTVSWQGYRDLGIWSKPGGAPFLCIEPWFSMASPVGFDGEFVDKPGILKLAPGETHDAVWRVTT